MTPPDTEPPRSDRRADAMRRLQVGGTGLILVALLVGLSTLLTSESRTVDPNGPVADSASAGAANGTAAPQGDDPLTDLGVEPAASEAAPAVPSPPPSPADATPAPVGPIVPDLQPDPQLEGAAARR